MRKTLAVVVTTLAIGALASPSIAGAGCGGLHTADKGGDQVASTTQQTPKPVQQTQLPTEQAK